MEYRIIKRTINIEGGGVKETFDIEQKNTKFFFWDKWETVYINEDSWRPDEFGEFHYVSWLKGISLKNIPFQLNESVYPSYILFEGTVQDLCEKFKQADQFDNITIIRHYDFHLCWLNISEGFIFPLEMGIQEVLSKKRPRVKSQSTEIL